LDKNLPCLGICFEGQLFARVSGAEVRKNPVMEIGGYDVKLTDMGKKIFYSKIFPAHFLYFTGTVIFSIYHREQNYW
jgi:GMP synthase-like glutamine amidotransferase